VDADDGVVYSAAAVEPPSGARAAGGGRRRAIPLAASSLFIATSVGGLGLVVQLYLKSLGASTSIIGLVATLNSAGLLLGSWLWGTVSDFVKRRRLLAGLALSLSASIGLLAFLPPMNLVLGTALVRFLFFAGFSAVSVAIISAASRVDRRGKNLSYISSARALGFAAGTIATGYALEFLGFRTAFAICAVLPLAGLALLMLLPSENPVRLRDQRSARASVFKSGILDLLFATMLRQMAILGTFSLLYVYMDSIGIGPGVMGAISASNTATQVLALLLFGWLADRIGRRPIFMLGFALSVLTPCIFIFAASAWGMVAGYITLAFSFSSLYVGATSHIGDRIPHEQHGQMLGLYESSRGFGGIFGPILAGFTVPLLGFKGMFLLMAGIATLALIVMLAGGAVRSRSPKRTRATHTVRNP